MTGLAVDPAPDDLASIDDAGYESLADFRYHVRRFFAFSEATTKAAGVAPAQYQALLAIRAHDGGCAISVSQLAERLFIKLNSAVELVQRLEVTGLVQRSRAANDHRRIELRLTTAGADTVERLATSHLAEHRRNLADLARIVAALGNT